MAINTYNESSLHRTLKKMFAPEGSEIEAELDGSICDIVHSDGSITEIQTANLCALRLKLEKFLPAHKVTVVYPIAVTTFIRLLNADSSQRSYRKSPVHGSFFQFFRELTGLWHALNNRNLYFCIVYIDRETTKIDDKKGRSRRNRPRIIDKTALTIHQTQLLHGIDEIFSPVLAAVPQEFGTAELRQAGAGKYANIISWLLRKTEYLPYRREKKKIIFTQ